MLGGLFSDGHNDLSGSGGVGFDDDPTGQSSALKVLAHTVMRVGVLVRFVNF
ncbi:MAG: hypothetical protein VX115_02795 [Candidatus Thermoplasmatota archaeon]|nr:hypothetical protein [Candidatus Thermoplasmatota archaeon]